MNIFFLTIILLNFFLVFYFERISLFLKIFDKPIQSHKQHKNNVSAIGGILLFINILFFLIFFFFNKDLFLQNSKVFLNFEELIFFLLIYLIFLGKGVLDDITNLNANLKFILSIIFIFFLIYFDENILIEYLIFSDIDVKLNLSWMKHIFTIFCFVTFINAMNMFDGINLQASIYSLFLLMFLLLNIGNDFLLITIIIFLIFFSYLNYKSKCFLGDGGSLTLGFIISYFFVKSYNIDSIILCDEIFLLMLIPGLELIRLTFLRLLEFRHPFSADRNHLHHILNKKFSAENTVLIIFGLVVVPILFNELTEQTILIIFLMILIYFFLIFKFKKF
jgi:UDP-GlcNAc:undecaprenyl-phosphate GlcNAc-1-phosphate transferase